MAQSLSSVKNEEISVAKAITFSDTEDETWAFYADETNKKYFIDFEKLHIYLDKIEIVASATNKVLFTDNLWNLPPDAIYELDCAAYEPGKYAIRLTSLTNDVKNIPIEIKPTTEK